MTSVLQPPPFRKRRVAFMAHHDMVQDTNIHQAQRFLKPLGNAPVGVARFGITTGMVVNEHDCSSRSAHSGPEDLPGMHETGCQSALRDLRF